MPAIEDSQIIDKKMVKDNIVNMIKYKEGDGEEDEDEDEIYGDE